jgi:hypothetical protein
MKSDGVKLFREVRERLLRAGVAPRHVRRYVAELGDHLADLRAAERKAGRNAAEAEAEALVRLGSAEDLAKAMMERRELQAWSVRAPWAVFGVGSLALLGVAYFAACIYLWALWQIFLPGAETPFGRGNGDVYGALNVLAQMGKYFYLLAPVLAGWAMVWMAARQRVGMIWPAMGAALIALMGSAAEIQASRSAVPHGLGHVRMNFTLGNSVGEFMGRMPYVATVLALTVAPYFLWRFLQAKNEADSVAE